MSKSIITAGGGHEAYPPGSVYITTNEENPSVLFGGEWELIEREVWKSQLDLSSCNNTLITWINKSEQWIMPDKSIFIKFFDHNNNGGRVLFSNKTEVGLVDTTGKFSYFSLLDGNDTFFKPDGKYLFRLTYPDNYNKDTYYNEWTQTLNPYLNTSVGTYSGIHISWSGNSWGGVALSTETNCTCMDGSPSDGTWYYAIGAYSPFGSGIPSWDSTSGRCQMWIKPKQSILYQYRWVRIK